jgi:hypothetical protein
MCARFILVANDVRHINVLQLTSPWRVWDWTSDRFRPLRLHPLYPIAVDNMMYTTALKVWYGAAVLTPGTCMPKELW